MLPTGGLIFFSRPPGWQHTTLACICSRNSVSLLATPVGSRRSSTRPMRSILRSIHEISNLAETRSIIMNTGALGNVPTNTHRDALCLPNRMTLHVISLYDSRVVLDHTCLSGSNHYSGFRRELFRQLLDGESERFVAEEYVPNGEADWERFENWKDTGHIANHSHWHEGQGITRKDVSLVMVQLADEIDIDVDLLDDPCGDILANTLRMKNLWLHLHEYGIGFISGEIDIEFNESTTTEEQRLTIEKLRDEIISDLPELNTIAERIDQRILDALTKLAGPFSPEGRVFEYDEVSSKHRRFGMLWTHGVSVYYSETLRASGIAPDQVPGDAWEPIASKMVRLTEPREASNLIVNGPGYAKIGWGTSMAVGINHGQRPAPPTLDRCVFGLLRTLRISLYDYRAMEQFNEWLSSRLDVLSRVPRRRRRRLRSALHKIDRISIETDLYEAHRANIVQNFSPQSHYLYRETARAWRLSQLNASYKDKLSSLQELRNVTVEAIAQLRQRELDIFVLIITMIALTSAIIDAMTWLQIELPGSLKIFALCSPLLLAASFFLLWFFRASSDSE